MPEDNMLDMEVLVVTAQATFLETRLARLEAKARAEGLTPEEGATLPHLRNLADDIAYALTGFPGEEVDA